MLNKLEITANICRCRCRLGQKNKRDAKNKYDQTGIRKIYRGDKNKREYKKK